MNCKIGWFLHSYTRNVLPICIAMATLASPSFADDFDWEASPSTTAWSNVLNWAGTPNQFPDDNSDTATISGVNLDDPVLDDNLTIGALTLQNEGDLFLGNATTGFRLIVQDNGGESGLTLIEGGGSTLDVFNSSFVIDFDTDDLTMNSGALLDINSAVVQVDRAADINTGAVITGDGTLRIDGTVNAINNGIIRAAGGTLTVNSTNSAEIDLDGDGTEGGTVQAFSNSTLIIDTPLTGPSFNGTIEISAGGEVQINSSVILEASTSNIDFNGGTATYSGTSLSLGGSGVMNVNSGTAVMAAPFSANTGSAINLTADTTLQFDAAATISDPDAINPSSGVSYIVNADVNIGTGTGNFDWDAFNPGLSTTTINDGATLTIDTATVDASSNDFDGTININSGSLSVTTDAGSWNMQGEMNLDSSGGGVPTVSGSSINFSGDVNASGNGASIIEEPTTWESNANVNVAANAALQIGNASADDIVYAGGSFAGAGELRQAGDAIVTQDTTIDTATFDWDIFSSTDTTIQDGVSFTINSTLTDAQSGDVTVQSGTLNVNTPWSLDGTLNLDNTAGSSPALNGSQLTVTGDVFMRGSSAINADVNMNGNLTVLDGGTAAMTGQTVFGGPSNVSVGAGQFLVLNDTEYQGGTHAGAGRVDQEGDILVSANTTINYGSYDWDGVSPGNTTTVAPGVAFTINTTNLDPNGGGNTDMDLNLLVGDGGVVTVNTPGAWGIQDGNITLQSPASNAPTARISGSDFVNNSPGRVMGNGVFNTNVENRGTFAPGLSTGLIRVAGDFTQTAGGTLEIEIETTTPITGHDQLEIAADADLAGTIDVTPDGGYADPAVAGTFDEFTLLLAATVVGMFDDFIYDGATLTQDFASGGQQRFHIADGLFRILDYDPSQVDLLNYKALPGDANGDGFVDGQDFIIWNANKFQAGTDWTTGDWNGDGVTDGSDFIIFNTNKFTGVNLGGLFADDGSVGVDLNAVPEPTAFFALMSALLCLGVTRRR